VYGLPFLLPAEPVELFVWPHIREVCHQVRELKERCRRTDIPHFFQRKAVVLKPVDIRLVDGGRAGSSVSFTAISHVVLWASLMFAVR
jgi:hypothetical protein